MRKAVIPVGGWSREMWWDNGSPWVPPRPNMPTLATASLIPAWPDRATAVSEGRGTTVPVEIYGAPERSLALAKGSTILDSPVCASRPTVLPADVQSWQTFCGAGRFT